MDLSDALDGFDSQAPSGGGAFIQPGAYLVMCEQIEFKKGYKGISFIGTNKVIKVLREEDGSNAEDGQANVVENMTKRKSVAQANMKAYLLALCESRYQKRVDYKQVKSDFAVVCAGPAQPLKGIYAFVDAIHKPREGKTAVTVKNWRMATNEELAPFGLAQPGGTPAAVAQA